MGNDGIADGELVACSEGCVRIILSSQSTVGGLTGSIDRLRDHVARHQVEKALVDARAMPEILRTVERFEIGEYIGANLTAGLRVAFLGSAAQVVPDRFLQTVANNRGANILVTTDPCEAAQWLGITLEFADPSS